MSGASLDRRTVREARRLVKEAGGLLARHQKKVSSQSREKVEAAIRDVEACLSGTGDKRMATAMKDLDRVVDEVLGFAKKGSVREFVESIAVAVAIAAFLRAFVLEAFKIPSESMIPTLLVGDHIFVNKFVYGLRVPFSNAWFVQWGEPERGDVIVFRFPGDTSKDFIKRVVGLPGDRIRVEGREVWVNGEKLGRDGPVALEYTEDAEPGAPPKFPVVHRTDAYREHPSGAAEQAYSVLYERRDLERMPLPAGIEHPGLSCTHDVAGRPDECVVEPRYLFVMGDNRDNSHDSRGWGGVPRDYVKGRAMFVWWSWAQLSGFRWDRLGTTVD